MLLMSTDLLSDRTAVKYGYRLRSDELNPEKRGREENARGCEALILEHDISSLST